MFLQTSHYRGAVSMSGFQAGAGDENGFMHGRLATRATIGLLNDGTTIEEYLAFSEAFISKWLGSAVPQPTT